MGLFSGNNFGKLLVQVSDLKWSCCKLRLGIASARQRRGPWEY